jgi:hypothetical protein
MPHSDAIHEAHAAQGEIREVQLLGLAERLEPGLRRRPEHGRDELGREAVMPGRDGRVGGEDAAPAHRLVRGGEVRRAPVAELRLDQREHRERRVALVQVEAVDACVAERAQHAHAADPEQGLLAEPIA